MDKNRKYFLAESTDDASKLAAEYFNSEPGKIITHAGTGEEKLVLTAYALTQKAFDNINEGFNLFYEQDGVYFEVYPRRGIGTQLDREGVSSYLVRKGLNQFVPQEAISVLSKGWGRAKIAPPQSERILKEDAVLNFYKNEMECFLKFLPPDPDAPLLSKDELQRRLKTSGLSYGIDENAIEEAFNEKSYTKQYLIATGTMPVDGIDGYLEFHFETGSRTYLPKDVGNGKIDFKQLDLFIPVVEGQLLVTRVPAIPGKSGYNVKGKELIPKPGKDVMLPKSKNTNMNNEKTALYAACTGLVEYRNDSVNVSNIYEVKGDCDMSVGNIDFDGSIKIKGNVISGLTIKASGSISIGGVVEGSDIIADGNIELNGIQGMDKGRIIAGGTISAQFIERATIIAGEELIADTIVHSTIEVGRTITLKGKRGSIMGGNAKAGQEVVARVIGSVMHTQTEIEVGLPPERRSRLVYLQKEIKKIEGELEKLTKIETYLARSAMKLSDENKEKIIASSRENLLQYSQQLTLFTEELNVLEAELQNDTNGKIHVQDTIYPGVKLTIASAVYKVDEDISYATFKLKDREVTYSSCEKGR